MRLLPAFFVAGPVVCAAIAGFSAAGCSGHHKSSHAPGVPIAVGATAGDGQVTISWSDVAGADHYILYFATEPGVTQENYTSKQGGGRITAVDNPHVDDGLDNGTTYFYVVTSVSIEGFQSADSQEVFASPSPWPIPTLVEAGTGDAIDPRLDIVTGGDVLAVWSKQETNRYAVHSARLPAGSSTWTAPAAIDSAAGYSYGARLVGGLATAVWHQGTGNNDDAWAAHFNGATWDAPARIEADANAVFSPDAAGAADGTTLACWIQSDGTHNRVQTSFYQGASFSAPAAADAGTTNADTPQAGIDAAGDGLVVYTQGGGVFASLSAAGTFQTPVLLSTTTAGAIAPALAMNAAGEAVAAWMEPNQGGFDLVGAHFSAGVWTTSGLLEVDAGSVSAPVSAIGPNGDGVVVFTQLAGLHTGAYANRFVPGSGWTGAERVDTDPSGDVKELSAAVSGNGNVTVVWSQEVVGNGGPGVTKNIYSNRYRVSQDSWGTAVLVSRPGLNESPSLVLASDGTATTAWTLYSGADRQIWSNQLP